MSSFDETWVGYAPAPVLPPETAEEQAGAFEATEDRTAVEGFRTRVTDATAVEHLVPDGVSYGAEPSGGATLSFDMVEELRRRLREAEAREEGSGVRERPTPEEGLARGESFPSTPGSDVVPTLSDDSLHDLEIDVDEPRTLEELDEVISSLPEIEVALAPHSESNFYAAFDDEHPDGIFVATYDMLCTAAPVYVVVHLPAGYRFRTPAIVEWVREPEAAAEGMPAGVGLKMCGLDHRMRRLIRSFARHRKPMFYVG